MLTMGEKYNYVDAVEVFIENTNFALDQFIKDFISIGPLDFFKESGITSISDYGSKITVYSATIDSEPTKTLIKESISKREKKLIKNFMYFTEGMTLAGISTGFNEKVKSSLIKILTYNNPLVTPVIPNINFGYNGNKEKLVKRGETLFTPHSHVRLAAGFFSLGLSYAYEYNPSMEQMISLFTSKNSIAQAYVQKKSRDEK